jgi:Uma2 family endonuclease
MVARPDFEPLAAPRTFPTTWDELCADPYFRDLPYRVELLSGGRIVMTPHKFVHSGYQKRIMRLLDRYAPPGESLTEVAIQTTQGVRVADMVWMSLDRYAAALNESVVAPAPEICIEVMSSANTDSELREKAAPYFAAGAKEVWICINGEMTFLPGPSQLAADFPTRIDLKCPLHSAPPLENEEFRREVNTTLAERRLDRLRTGFGICGQLGFIRYGSSPRNLS